MLIRDLSLVEGRTVEEYIVAEWKILKCNIVVVVGSDGRGLLLLGLGLFQLHLSAGRGGSSAGFLTGLGAQLRRIL